MGDFLQGHEFLAVKRKAQILAIFARGNIAVFTRANLIRPELTVVKKVKEWNADDMGDLKAFESNASTPYVCWESGAYTLTEESPL